MPGVRGTQVLLERERELALLEEAIAAAADDRGSLVLVRGPAGIGKSELLSAVGSRAAARGFETLDARPLADRAREELSATGAKPRRVMLSGVESLTPSELRVANLAARGLGNREIAQQLFVSVKTVETHLGHAYRKLDISSRKDLPEALSGAEPVSGST